MVKVIAVKRTSKDITVEMVKKPKAPEAPIQYHQMDEVERRHRHKTTKKLR
jgi:hypothetical protein